MDSTCILIAVEYAIRPDVKCEFCLAYLVMEYNRVFFSRSIFSDLQPTARQDRLITLISRAKQAPVDNSTFRLSINIIISLFALICRHGRISAFEWHRLNCMYIRIILVYCCWVVDKSYRSNKKRRNAFKSRSSLDSSTPKLSVRRFESPESSMDSCTDSRILIHRLWARFMHSDSRILGQIQGFWFTDSGSDSWILIHGF